MSSHYPVSDLCWQQMRSNMPIAKKWAYFDHAAVSPLPFPTQQAITLWCQEAAQQGDTQWDCWAHRIEQVRSLAAKMIGADTNEIALVPNTTAGINLVADGLDWHSGENIVTLANEFPSNLYPWMNLADRGVETRPVAVDGVQVDLNRIAEACDENTRLISVSWVGYASGWRIDVDQLVALAHERGILVFLDAIQALGVFPIDVQQTKIDFLAADGHKWLLGPEGAGIFFTRREHLEHLRPIGVGWNSVVQGHDFSRIELNLRPAASRYEGGSQNMVGMFGLGASLEFLAQYGLSSSQSPLMQRVLEMTDLTCRRLEEIGAKIVSCREGESRSGIVAFELPGLDPNQQRKKCMNDSVVLNCRNRWLRISPHAYVSEEDIDRLIDVLQKSRNAS